MELHKLDSQKGQAFKCSGTSLGHFSSSSAINFSYFSFCSGVSSAVPSSSSLASSLSTVTSALNSSLVLAGLNCKGVYTLSNSPGRTGSAFGGT